MKVVPGKRMLRNTYKVGIMVFFLINFLMHACLITSVLSDSSNTMDCSPPRLLCPWDSPGKNTGVGCHVLLQGIFLT